LAQNNNLLKDKISIEFDKIVSNIEQHEKIAPNQSYGLLGGSSSLILIYYFLRDEDKMYKAIKTSLNQLSENNFSFNYSTGITGLNWILNFISENGQIDSNYFSEVKDDLHSMIMDIPRHNNFTRNLDFLHGMTGIIHYLIDYGNNKKSQQIILEYLRYIDSCKIKSKFGYYVTFESLQDKSTHIDYGLAHGLASVIQVLSRIYAKGIEVNLSKKLVTGFVEFMLNNKNNPDSCFSHFPTSFEKINNNTRLAWCYGDLGIAMAIRQAGVNLNNKEWIRRAEEFFLHSTKRISKESTLLYEPMLCHGSSGLAVMYNRIYRDTKNKLYKDQSDYWFKQTLDFSVNKGEYKGYRKYLHDENKWEVDYTFLEGSTGVALSYLTFLSQEDLGWEKSLLID